ncbi:hypothetical protein CQR51_1693 [Bifidobacterium pseudolongum subsp. globosum]|nr:hypothetical protein CQR51_1693 [Bifidobacterium pseudolongum subsp. globosum]
MHPPLLPSVTAFWDGNSVCFLAMGSALSLRVVLLWGAAYYDPPFFNDCRWRLREEPLPVAGGALPVAKKVLPVAVAGSRPCRIRCLCHPHGCWCRWSDISSHGGRGYWTPVTDLSHLLLF